MKLLRGAGINLAGIGLFLSGLVLIFSNLSMAADDPCEGQVYEGRTCLDNAGDAEVIADTGYKHTLFDSADNKCQHCHNDLYDTWKTSMHAKSWEDPLFQAKYQDFLRLQASKIGATGPTGTYGEDTIQKTAQVCIKCHAPTAYYSGDYKVTLKRIGGNHEDATYLPKVAYAEAKTLETNLSKPPAGLKYNKDLEATVASLAKTGQAYTVTYHIGNSHNREGINCSFCHSIETVRMFDKYEGSDGGKYTLKNPIKMGPIGPVVREAGDKLKYSSNADAPDMNAFFALIGPEKYADVGNTPKVKRDFDVNKTADGRYTMKSFETGCGIEDENGNCVGTSGYYTGGPFYGPFGVTGLSNSRDDDLSNRGLLVKAEFQDAVYAEHGDKFTSEHQFAAYGKALCLSCHQRSSLMLNPESNGDAGVQATGKNPDQFLELCSTWTAMSDGVGDNFTDTRESPKCQRCHMEPLIAKGGDPVTVLHQWDQPDKLFTLADNPELTEHFLPPSDGGTVGPVAEGYLNNHSFLGHSQKNSAKQLVKVQSGFESELAVETGDDGDKLIVKTSLQNKTAHMFPGAHPMRRVVTRVRITGPDGNVIPFESAKGKSRYKTITNQLATLDGDTIMDGFDTVEVKYDDDRNIVIQGYTPDLDEDGEPVMSQKMDQTEVPWSSPDGTVTGTTPVQDPDSGTWSLSGVTTVKKIIDDSNNDYFTRIYGRETGKRKEGIHVVRPGFDSNIAADNRLKPNEKEKYRIVYDTSGIVGDVKVEYRVYYLKKGGSGKFPVITDPTDPEVGFLDTQKNKVKKMGISEVAKHVEVVTLN